MTELTYALLDQLFTVDIGDGKLYWKVAPKGHPRLLNKEAGSSRKTNSGKFYWHIKIGGIPYKRGHLIFLFVNGRLPHPCLDHIDGDSLNDRSSNIREATVTENAWNHKKRKRRIKLPMGVRILASGRFQARLGYRGAQLHLGAFDTPEDARSAHIKKRKELYGKFA